MKRFFLSACVAGLWACAVNAQSAAPGLNYQVQNYPTPAPLGECGTTGTTGCTAAGCEGGERLSGKFKGKSGGSLYGGCAAGSCESRSRSGRFLDWLCYKPQFADGVPCFQPTPYLPPLYNWFPCQDSCGHGCASGGCGATVAVTGMPAVMDVSPAMPAAPPAPMPSKDTRGTAPQTVPTAKRAPAVPGLRFATAEQANVGGKPVVQPWPGINTTAESRAPSGVMPASYTPKATK